MIMKTIAQQTMLPIHAAEADACARLYDLVGLGDEYRAPFDVGSHRNVIAEFTRRGYETVRIVSKVGADYQMLLLHNGVEVACILISIDIRIGDVKVFGDVDSAQQ